MEHNKCDKPCAGLKGAAIDSAIAVACPPLAWRIRDAPIEALNVCNQIIYIDLSVDDMINWIRNHVPFVQSKSHPQPLQGKQMLKFIISKRLFANAEKEM